MGSSAAGALDNRAEVAENGCTIILSHALANDYNTHSVTQNGCHIWRTKCFDAGGFWRLVNNCHDCRFWRCVGQA